LDNIQKYESHISKWISEPDSGVYDAMNKGILHSTGDILYFLNAGDILYGNKTIEKIIEKFSDNLIMGIYGNVEIINQQGTKKSTRGCKVTINSLLYRRICHQALFVRRILFDQVGTYSLSLKFSADHEFIVKSLKKYPSGFLYVNEIIAKYRDEGMSWKMMEKTKFDDLKIISSNYNTIHFLFGAAVCALVILKYKVPRILSIHAHVNKEKIK
jgi:glycosyltransferase involved in cell wall biosynthesis